MKQEAMKQIENLYNYVPPSFTWKKKTHFIEAKHNWFWLLVWEFYINQTLKKRFASIRIKNQEALEKCNKNYPYIFFAQHNNWWDGMLGWVLCHHAFNIKMNIMVEDLAKFPLLAEIGCFSVNKKSPKSTLKMLNYCIDFLKNKEESLYIFPQGIINPPEFRPLNFSHGASYIAQKLGKVNLVPIVPKFTFLRLGQPEILVDVGDPIVLDENNVFPNKENLSTHMEQKYTAILNEQHYNISNGKIEEYEVFYAKPDGLGKRIEKWCKSRF